jgi:5-carboxymethyl-2-hydroxymuconate isomerase
MPHAIIEYSENIADKIVSRHILHVVHGVMQTSGLFDTNAVKTRAYGLSHCLVGDAGSSGSFIHIIVYLLDGRTPAQKQQLSQSIFDILNERLSEVDSITVDIRDLDRQCYKKK